MKTVILTNERGENLGTAERGEAHGKNGMLHKAFSVFVFTPNRSKLLIQQRASGKLFGRLWANTCCSHLREELPIEEEAAKRLEEECGFRCALKVHSSFIYRAEDPSGRGAEHEHDTILIGEAEESIELDPDPEEITEMKWVVLEDLQDDMKAHPDHYAPWFHQALKRIILTIS